ncbi:putative protein involved in cytokinesis, contains TGc (transglutaminase/protease-like) domain [Agrobacterium sp. DSM 25558]|uniref:DUF3857 domain-containing protein n=1 Tax=Agrobacterium sp. DSM 25558 TaxID=1907665 RepID=UPI0009725D9A|nr:DUF3857 domain-containing protein [Agrobacterium sp. DSM 25558]SCX28659.1 putative protein involved in cytokinesis, contains TGc (transglutaminase/protease-like) domain [Agrobacterium sp. DSM 25558]
MNSDTSKMSREALLHRATEILLLSSVCLLAIDLPARAAETVEQSESLHYEVAPDYSYKLTVVADRFVDKQAEVNDASHISYTYDPDRTAFHLVEGWVDGPDGTRHEPAPDAIFTRPSAASRDAPGFVSSVTTTVVMPGVVKGSHVHYKAEETVRKLPLMGFNPMAWLSPFMTADERVVIDIPADLPLSIGSQGGFVVSDTTTDGMRHIVADASMRNVSMRDREPHMAPTEEFGPMFLATSLKSYEAAGAIYHRVNEDKATVKPDIEALARKIVGDRKGLDAARAIYDWIAKNIRYLAVYRNDDAGEESHDASTVLKNGYGDCKDHVTLMQALLAAVGIRAEPALIDWSNRDKPLPIWSSRETNHAIVYLPDFDVFANPTSPFTPFGALDQNLSGKLAILAGEKPQVRQTPAMTPKAGRFTTNGTIHIAADGTVDGTATATMAPSLEEGLRARLQDSDRNDAQIDQALRDTPEGGFGHLKTSDTYDMDHPLELSMNWHSPHGIEPTANAFVLPTPPSFAPMEGLRSYLDRDSQRKTPMALPVRDIVSTYTVTLPPDLRIAAAPKDVSVDTPVGSYTATYALNGDELLVRRRLVIKSKRIEPSAYPDLERVIYAAQGDQTAIVTMGKPG